MHARLRHVCQAVEHGARPPQNGHERRVLLCDHLAYPGGERRRRVVPLHVNQVLDRYWDAVQGPDGLPGCLQDLVKLSRTLESLLKEELGQWVNLVVNIYQKRGAWLMWRMGFESREAA